MYNVNFTKDYCFRIVEHRSEARSDWKSIYKINDKVCCCIVFHDRRSLVGVLRVQVRSATEYTAKLESIGIYIKARNFLVFQVNLVFKECSINIL